VSGSEGGVWRTTDRGRTWKDVSPTVGKVLLFRDVEATDARHAQVLAIGEGTDSRIFRTSDGGRHWRRTFTNRDPAAFYDCMAMWPGGRRGLAVSDPVRGKFRIIATRDGGASWHRVSRAGMPAARPGEFAFAASGTCLVTAGRSDAYLATGGGAARVFFTRDHGRHWKVRDSTLPASPAGGVFSLAFRTRRDAVAVGGDFEAETDGTDRSAVTHSFGRSWRNAGDLGGYRSGVAWKAPGTAVAVGPTGTDVTRDGGRTWHTFSTTDFDAVQCAGGRCWASGPDGRVGRLVRR
jgi:photosystem II stability/assembly factor-like uncharacterized protein